MLLIVSEQYDNVIVELSPKYISKFNAKFAVAPKRKSDLHKKISKQTKEKLPQIFSIQDQRKVNNDYTVMFKNNFFQLDREQTTTVYKKGHCNCRRAFGWNNKIKIKG